VCVWREGTLCIHVHLIAQLLLFVHRKLLFLGFSGNYFYI